MFKLIPKNSTIIKHNNILNHANISNTTKIFKSKATSVTNLLKKEQKKGILTEKQFFFFYIYSFFEKLKPIFLKKLLNTIFLKHGKKHLTEKYLLNIINILNSKLKNNIYLKYSWIPKQKYWKNAVPCKQTTPYTDNFLYKNMIWMKLKKKNNTNYNFLKCNLRLDITPLLNKLFQGESLYLKYKLTINFYRKFFDKIPLYYNTLYLTKYKFTIKNIIKRLFLFQI